MVEVCFACFGDIWRQLCGLFSVKVDFWIKVRYSSVFREFWCFRLAFYKYSSHSFYTCRWLVILIYILEVHLVFIVWYLYLLIHSPFLSHPLLIFFSSLLLLSHLPPPFLYLPFTSFLFPIFLSSSILLSLSPSLFLILSPSSSIPSLPFPEYLSVLT